MDQTKITQDYLKALKAAKPTKIDHQVIPPLNTDIQFSILRKKNRNIDAKMNLRDPSFDGVR